MMPPGRNVIGLDIGGANLKLADSRGRAVDQAFPLWKHPEELASTLETLLQPFADDASAVAVTMTGELADCFEDAAQGVCFIAGAVRTACAALSRDNISHAFYSLDGHFAPYDEVLSRPDDFAASNWYALAQFLCQMIDEPTLLIDVGSTTCDVIPLQPGALVTPSRTDFDRLQAGELVYVGCRRTPVCAVVDRLPYRGADVPVMNELFATTDDCALVLGFTAEDADDTDTADGRPRTRVAAIARLARMIGLDHRHVTPEDAVQISRHVWSSVADRIGAAITRHPACDHWILSGHGQSLLQGADPQPARITNLADTDGRLALGPQLSRVAPAYAVACLLAKANAARESDG